MPSNFPDSDDVFTEPSSPGSTALSSAGSGSRNHTQHHRDLGDAIEAIEANVPLKDHDHSGSGSRATNKLDQANTHESADTDSSTSAIHHTIGTGANQAAAGNHTHTQSQSHNSVDTDSSTSAIHHTLGTGANQAARGNHTHEHPILLFYTSNNTFTKATYPGLYAIEVEVIGGGGGSGGTESTSSSQFAVAGGGAGGGYAKALILASSLASSVTITVGAGGSAGASNATGGTGGTTSFGSHVTASGGTGGIEARATHSGAGTLLTSTRSGGTPGGTYNVGVAGAGHGSAGTAYRDVGGNIELSDARVFDGLPAGGPYGQIRRSAVRAGGAIEDVSPQSGLGYGSGASGQSRPPSSSGRSGAAGSAGLVVIRLIF